MLRVQCPSCHTLISVAAIPPGGQIGCPSCGQPMLLNAPVPPPKPVKAVVIRKPEVVDDDEVIDLQQPAQPVRPVIVARAAPVQPAPHRPMQAGGAGKRPSAPAPAHDHDDDYRRPRKKRKAEKSIAPWLIGGGIGLAALIIVGVILIMTLRSLDKPAAIAQQNNAGKSLMRDEEVQSTPKKNKADNSDKNNQLNMENKENDTAASENNNKESNATKNEEASSGTSNASDNSSETTVQPSSLGGVSQSNGAAVFKYALKSAAFIIVVSKDGRSMAMGSGSLIDRKNRLVLTNHHVAGDAAMIAVFFPKYDKNGKLIAAKSKFVEQFQDKRNVIEAKRIATNPLCDLCVIQLPRVPDGVEALPFSKDGCEVGQQVHSIGNPVNSGGLWAYAPGIVRQVIPFKWRSTASVHEATVIETQSPTNHGDSGGPLVNDRGELVGVTQGGSGDGVSSISIFIDISEVKRFIEREVKGKLNQAFATDTRAPLNVGGNAAGIAGGVMTGSLSDLVSALSDSDSTKKAKAVEALGMMGDKARDAIPALFKLLADPNEFIRRSTTTALGKIGLPAKSDLPMLVAALNDSNLDMRRYAATTMEKMGTDASSVSSDLMAALRDADPIVRQAAARSMGYLGREALETAKPRLEALLKDNDRDTRQAAAEGLAGLLGNSGDLEGLTKLLKNADAGTRVMAAKACTKMGKNAKPVLFDLLTLAKDDNGELRKAVIKVLSQVDVNDAKPGINLVVEALKNGDKDTKLLALDVIGKITREVQPPMVAAVKECIKDADLKPACIETLKKFAPSSKSSLILLVELVKDDDSATSDAAIKAIIDLGPAAAGAVGELIKLMDISGNVVTRNDEARVTKYANLLAKIGKNAVPTLRKGLNSRSITRWGCVKALGEIGPPAREAVRELQGLIQIEPNEFIRKDIQEAIQKILNP